MERLPEGTLRLIDEFAVQAEVWRSPDGTAVYCRYPDNRRLQPISITFNGDVGRLRRITAVLAVHPMTHMLDELPCVIFTDELQFVNEIWTPKEGGLREGHSTEVTGRLDLRSNLALVSLVRSAAKPHDRVRVAGAVGHDSPILGRIDGLKCLVVRDGLQPRTCMALVETRKGGWQVLGFAVRRELRGKLTVLPYTGSDLPGSLTLTTDLDGNYRIFRTPP